MEGRNSGAVLYAAPSKKFSIQRNYVYPTLTANNHQKGAEYKNLAQGVWANASVAYKGDFAIYASRFYSENKDLPNNKIPVNNAFGQFVRGMYNWRDSDPQTVDLETVTVADMVALDTEMQTVATAVAMGWLPIVETYLDLDSPIQEP